MSEIEEKILTALKCKSKLKKESHQEYLLRLVKTSHKKWWGANVPEEAETEWEDLGDPAQQWLNDNVSLYIRNTNEDADEPIGNFPDVEEATEETEEPGEGEMVRAHQDDDEDVMVDEKPAKAKKADKVETKKVDKPAKKVETKKVEEKTKKVEAKTDKKKPLSMSQFVRHLLIKKPTTTVDELVEKTTEAGYPSVSKLTLSSIRHDTRATFKALIEKGKLEMTL